MVCTSLSEALVWYMSISWVMSLLHSVLFSLSYVSLFRVDQPRNWVRAYRNEIQCLWWGGVAFEIWTGLTRKRIFPYFCDLFIILVEGLAVFSVEESGDSNNFFLFIDNRKGEDILDLPSSLIHRFFLSYTRSGSHQFGSGRGDRGGSEGSLTWKVKYSSAVAFIMLQI